MRILAVDTATRGCSVAVTDDGDICGELTLVKKETHSKHLLDMIDKILGLTGYDVSDIDGFAVTTGPGSFTGLRIGISVVKGMAFAAGKPVVGISSLDALAQQFLTSSLPLCIMLDARKSEVYAARYGLAISEMISEETHCVIAPDKFIDGIDTPHLFAGSGAVQYRDVIAGRLGANAVFTEGHRNVIRAADVAALAVRKFENGEVDDIRTVAPEYIRKSDAELNFG